MKDLHMNDIKRSLNLNKTYTVNGKIRDKRWDEAYFTEDGKILILACLYKSRSSSLTSLFVWETTKENFHSPEKWEEIGEIDFRVKRSIEITYYNDKIFFFADNNKKIYRYSIQEKELKVITKKAIFFHGDLILLRFAKDNSCLEIKFLLGKERTEHSQIISGIWKK